MRWLGTATERRREGRGSKEENEVNKMARTRQQKDSLTATAGFGEERGDGGPTRFRRREREHHVERDEVNPTVSSTAAEAHGWRQKSSRTSFGDGDFFDEIRHNKDGTIDGDLGFWER